MTTIHQDQARQWLEKFLDGRTSNEEEKALYAFFASDEVPKDLRKYKKMFAWYAGKMQGELPHRAKTRRKIMRGLSIAASVLLLAGIGFGVQKHIEQQKVYESYEGSYILHNGKKITDIREILPRLQATESQVKILKQEVHQQITEKNDEEELPVI